ncbi:serine hydrolase domain-containing protein [Pseudonocardia cypriaca]|uniref:CubicO group peptidase (Beta-lactamase class C family) n=1 Tax=Pseudonocardia cypriaca TaxID=882449 RepID=A0A543FQL2_9PSEU|nr:serine hydrolase domain-containing protein [Pseudonocardia cypriaca]TQM36132.1 CubicO group peptidase (beta-lactamase class C family) [Pseudonocardia cypriaca]
MTLSPARTAQEAIQRRLDDLVDSGVELGAQVAAYVGDELVVHAWAGVADPATGRPVDGNTLFPVFSVSKGILTTAVHRLVERDVLRYDTGIAELWPEFGTRGKEAVTVAHVLEHSAGIPYFPTGLTPDDLADYDRVVSLVADLEPAWDPGTMTGYHSLTFGYLVAEVVRRATGRTVDEVVRTEVAEPLGIEDQLFIVPPTEQAHRLADIDATDFVALQAQLPSGNAFQKVVGGIRVDSIVPRRVAPAGRSWAMDAFLPFGATMTARAGAALYGALASGGGRLLSPERVALATRIRRRDTDQIIGAPALKSLGYLHADPVSGGIESAFGFGGLGGAEAYADPERRLGFAFTHNRLTPPTAEESAPGLAALLRENLGVA